MSFVMTEVKRQKFQAKKEKNAKFMALATAPNGVISTILQ